MDLRTPAQHNTEWLYYQIMADASGHTAYEIYEVMAGILLQVIDEDGDLAYIKPSTLSVSEHNLYMERLRCLAAEYNICLPEPSTEPEQRYNFKKIRKK